MGKDFTEPYVVIVQRIHFTIFFIDEDTTPKNNTILIVDWNQNQFIQFLDITIAIMGR